jgi:hypothetical protein
VFDIKKAPVAEVHSDSALATQRQRDFAKSLGIEFPENVTKSEIGRLIGEARVRRDEELEARHGKAWEEARKQIIAEIDEDDCRLSKATPAQMVDELCNRDLGAVLVFFKLNEVDLDHLEGAHVGIHFSDNLTEAQMYAVLGVLGVQALGERRRGKPSVAKKGPSVCQVKVRCPGCGTDAFVDMDDIGQQGACQKCRKVFKMEMHEEEEE